LRGSTTRFLPSKEAGVSAAKSFFGENLEYALRGDIGIPDEQLLDSAVIGVEHRRGSSMATRSPARFASRSARRRMRELRPRQPSGPQTRWWARAGALGLNHFRHSVHRRCDIHEALAGIARPAIRAAAGG
jgi:hypothetical protein